MKLPGNLFLIACVLLAASAAESQQPPASKEKQTSGKAAAADTKTKRQRVVSNLAGFDLLDPSKTQKQPMVVGATRGLPQAVALAPRLGKIYELHPVFTWSFAGKTGSFVWILTDADQTEIFRAEVSGKEFRYPATAPALEPGKTYFWAVQTQLGMLGTTSSEAVGIMVLTAAQREEIAQALAKIAATEPYEHDCAKARIFTDRRLWYDAVTAYSDLIARYPAKAELYEQRGMIYAQLAPTRHLSEQDFARADELRKAK